MELQLFNLKDFLKNVGVNFYRKVIIIIISSYKINDIRAIYMCVCVCENLENISDVSFYFSVKLLNDPWYNVHHSNWKWTQTKPWHFR